MGFIEIENAGKKILEQFPLIKRSCKKAYQLINCLLSHEKIKYEGNIVRVSPEDGYEYFYGYYDKSPWDASDRYIIALKVKQTYKSVAPREPGLLILLDTQENKVEEIGIVYAWNVQQGCMAQWMGPDFKSRIIYNDFRNGKYCSVIFNIELMQEEKTLSLPVYDVAKDGSYALSLDFARLHRLRPGYGYSNLAEITAKELCPNNTCIWRIDIINGQITELLKYTDMAAFEPDKSMKDAEHKVNHIMISPNGKRFMVLHRWFKKGRKHTRLVTINADGTDMYNLSDDVFVSHCYWKNNEEILSFLRKQDTGEQYYLLRDKTHDYRLFWPRLNTDGHCSYSPDGSLIITDSYPNRKRMAFIYVCREEQQQPVRIAKVFAPFKYDNDCRCDLHPRWNRIGDKICFDSVHDGKRAIYVLPITKKDIPAIPCKKPVFQAGKYKIAYIITNCKNSGPMNQTLNIIKNLNREMFEPIVITLFQEDLGNSVVQRYLDVVPEFYCLGMGKLYSIVEGKKKLIVLLNRIRPNVIHGLGMPPYTMSLGYTEAIHLVTLRNYCYQDYPDKYGKLLGTILAHKDIALIRKQVKKGETFVTCSQSLAEMYKKYENLKFNYIRNGVDVASYVYAKQTVKDNIREKLGLPSGKIIAIYTGQLIDRKNQEAAIQGILQCNRAKDIVLLLLGDGTNRKSLEERYGSIERIIFKGNVTNVNEYLQASDFYITTSKSEGMPNGMLEAMATGLPIVVSDIPQHLEVFNVDDRVGKVYHLEDAESLVKAIDALLGEDLGKMGEYSYQSITKNFTARAMSVKYQQLYSRLLEKQ